MSIRVMPHRSQRVATALAVLLLVSLLAPAFAGAEWTHWRGPNQNGTSSETGLISSWSVDGENVVWRADFVGRSTAAVFDGRACAIGRDGEEILRQEIVVCWDAENGEQLWEHRFTAHNTFVPWQRLGWAHVAGDSETGYLFAHTSDGVLAAFDREGSIVWHWRLGEDIARLSGYGGRTHSPIVDEDRVILAAINSSWGTMGGPGSMRYWAFDKRTGEVLFAAKPSPRTKDANTQSTPIVAIVNGERLLIGASSDGFVYAVNARTGEKRWQYQLSQVSLNAGVTIDDKGRVFASHSEENVDTGTMGRMVAIDGTGTGDAEEIWRIPDLKAGFGTPLFHDGRVYHLDNSANLYAIDAATGNIIWEHNVGTVGKSGPVWADGKIYITEVNGRFHILKDAGDKAEVLDSEEIFMPDGVRPAEIYASPAVAYGRIYFATENGFFCLGDKSKAFQAKPGVAAWPSTEAEKAPTGKVASIQVVPAEVVTTTDASHEFRVLSYDANGRFLGEKAATSWSLRDLKGKVSSDGQLSLEDVNGLQLGYVVAKVGEVEGEARVRAAGPLPWSEDFNDLPAGPFPQGGFPPGWLGRGPKKTHVEEVDGEKVLVQPDPKFFAPRVAIYMGPSFMKGYTVQADIYATREKRRKPELGIINSGYTMLLAGIQQRVEIRSWGSELRMMQRHKFAWETDTWYTIKMRVDFQESADSPVGEQAVIKGKAWKRGEAEPADWMFTATDPLPIRQGAPGLYGFTPVPGYFDNVKITKSE
ncbi:MAG: PQQ-like beta-propeller repeat protein [Thermoanaerobaculia bacterium]|nr:PQQ-like beta-propeller repeat protein [Thermoanaerobaculia bacterium]